MKFLPQKARNKNNNADISDLSDELESIYSSSLTDVHASGKYIPVFVYFFSRGFNMNFILTFALLFVLLLTACVLTYMLLYKYFSLHIFIINCENMHLPQGRLDDLMLTTIVVAEVLEGGIPN